MYPNGDELSERKKRILKAVVEAHITHGEPVGSKYLTQAENLSLSPATIRNEMAELEAMGYLEQPHTSAGRIPSEAGYRFYVNALMQSYDLTAGELRELNNLVKSKAAELDKILDTAGHLMSSLTNYTSLAVRQTAAVASVLHFKTVYFDQNSFLLVLMIQPDNVKTKYIHTDFELNEELMGRMEEILNSLLAGVPLERITLSLIVELEKRLGIFAPLAHSIVKEVHAVLEEFGGSELKFEGLNRLLEYPEYADVSQLRDVLDAFEDKEQILEVVSKAQKEGVNVFIGSENPLDTSNNSTLIFQTIFSADGKPIGAIGVIGPRRMDYSKVITTVQYLTRQIGEMLGGAPRALPEKKADGEQKE